MQKLGHSIDSNIQYEIIVNTCTLTEIEKFGRMEWKINIAYFKYKEIH